MSSQCNNSTKKLYVAQLNKNGFFHFCIYKTCSIVPKFFKSFGKLTAMPKRSNLFIYRKIFSLTTLTSSKRGALKSTLCYGSIKNFQLLFCQTGHLTKFDRYFLDYLDILARCVNQSKSAKQNQ